jgi:hypothetical protein
MSGNQDILPAAIAKTGHGKQQIDNKTATYQFGFFANRGIKKRIYGKMMPKPGQI